MGAGVLSARYRVPIYSSPGTRQARSLQIRNAHEFRQFRTGSSFSVNTLTVHPFSVSHDANEPNGFTVSRNGSKIGFATDMGIATHMVRDHLKGCEILFIEANHDPNMLMNGPYPWHLKQRIRSRTGHLSNHDTGNLLKDIQHDHLSLVVLAHLSETNNTPQLALEAVRSSLHCGAQVTVASQDTISDVVYI
jgi:phosphoribosyl 1,2-cyclic phosphodiesterase